MDNPEKTDNKQKYKTDDFKRESTIQNINPGESIDLDRQHNLSINMKGGQNQHKRELTLGEASVITLFIILGIFS
jgi:hypothetical protein